MKVPSESVSASASTRPPVALELRPFGVAEPPSARAAMDSWRALDRELDRVAVGVLHAARGIRPAPRKIRGGSALAVKGSMLTSDNQAWPEPSVAREQVEMPDAREVQRVLTALAGARALLDLSRCAPAPAPALRGRRRVDPGDALGVHASKGGISGLEREVDSQLARHHAAHLAPLARGLVAGDARAHRQHQGLDRVAPDRMHRRALVPDSITGPMGRWSAPRPNGRRSSRARRACDVRWPRVSASSRARCGISPRSSVEVAASSAVRSPRCARSVTRAPGNGKPNASRTVPRTPSTAGTAAFAAGGSDSASASGAGGKLHGDHGLGNRGTRGFGLGQRLGRGGGRRLGAVAGEAEPSEGQAPHADERCADGERDQRELHS